MLVQWSYLLHIVGVIIFVPFLFLPVIVRQWDASKRAFGSLGIWKGLFHLGHLYLIISLITGLVITSNFASSWFWLVVLLYIMLGAFMGITAKYFRLVTNNGKGMEIEKLKRFSSILAAVIFLITVLMFVRW